MSVLSKVYFSSAFRASPSIRASVQPNGALTDLQVQPGFIFEDWEEFPVGPVTSSLQNATGAVISILPTNLGGGAAIEEASSLNGTMKRLALSNAQAFFKLPDYWQLGYRSACQAGFTLSLEDPGADFSGELWIGIGPQGYTITSNQIIWNMAWRFGDDAFGGLTNFVRAVTASGLVSFGAAGLRSVYTNDVDPPFYSNFGGSSVSKGIAAGLPNNRTPHVFRWEGVGSNNSSLYWHAPAIGDVPMYDMTQKALSQIVQPHWGVEDRAYQGYSFTGLVRQAGQIRGVLPPVKADGWYVYWRSFGDPKKLYLGPLSIYRRWRDPFFE